MKLLTKAERNVFQRWKKNPFCFSTLFPPLFCLIKLYIAKDTKGRYFFINDRTLEHLLLEVLQMSS